MNLELEILKADNVKEFKDLIVSNLIARRILPSSIVLRIAPATLRVWP